MLYSKAFDSLGYKLISVRQDWSAESEDGICVSIWKRELDWDKMVWDTSLHAKPIQDWGNKPGNSRRIAHAKRALEEFVGWIDVVLVSGSPGRGYEDAQPWIPDERGGRRWRITALDESTGQIRIEVQQP